ncbi:MAG: AI-2E family transporter [Bacteroidetes bacterium]|jgi:predicted PurR-regulated permease PerM|uniref:AI-2E family transporter n=1 Tax=Candidatus Cryptobacteroides avicola TaxID=2840757 RepID=A0A940IIP6_9BACT|nr:AI-2E family transporter [Candidatus Cryptobacteroides avicola]
MEKERSVDKLARYMMYTAVATVVLAICWFFRDVIIYMLAAGLVSLIGQPIMTFLNKLKIKGHGLPSWIYAILTLVIIIGLFLAIVATIIPIIAGIAKDISMVNVESAAMSISVPLKELNDFLIAKFPGLGADFRIETAILNEIKKLNVINASLFSSIINSIASFVASFGVGIFSVMFIAFFFLKDNKLFENIIGALVPDKHEQNAREAYNDIEHLLSRYFIGLIIEILGVALIDFLGLLLIARLGFNASIGIAFICGVLNIIPYVGPLMGGVIGSVLAIVMKYCCALPVGLDVNFWVFIIILIAIFWFAQIIDGLIYQPVIYSNSIKANALEIFIVLLMAGYIGGIIGMLVAIPCYTVIRVIAARFFRNVKFIRKLTGENNR